MERRMETNISISVLMVKLEERVEDVNHFVQILRL